MMEMTVTEFKICSQNSSSSCSQLCHMTCYSQHSTLSYTCKQLHTCSQPRHIPDRNTDNSLLCSPQCTYREDHSYSWLCVCVCVCSSCDIIIRSMSDKKSFQGQVSSPKLSLLQLSGALPHHWRTPVTVTPFSWLVTCLQKLWLPVTIEYK